VIINGSTGISGTDGTAATPAVQGTDTNTGMFFPAADTIAFSEGGTEVMRINPTGVVNFSSPPTVAGVSVLAGPAFSAFQNPSQTAIPANTVTKLIFQNKEFDTNNNYSTATSRFTPTVAGYYQISAAFTAKNNFSYGTIYIFKNGAEAKLGAGNGIGNTSNVWPVSALIYMNGSTDYIEIYGLMTVSQVPLETSAATYFQAFLARAA
jgi:hypothetical protein